MNNTKRKKANLWRGLIALGIIVILVMIAGVLLYTKDNDVIYGEAEATEYRVSGKLPGRIEEYYFEEGDKVKKGDTLVFINSPEIQAKLSQAQAAQKAASAQKAKAYAGARKEQIAGALAIWQKAEVGVDIAKKSYDRVQSLYEKMCCHSKNATRLKHNTKLQLQPPKQPKHNMKWPKTELSAKT